MTGPQVLEYNGRLQPLKFINFFYVYKWKPTDSIYYLYMEQELRRLHRSFGHPSINSLTKLLQRANPTNVDPKVVQSIEELTKASQVSAVSATLPKRFKLALGTEEFRFNHIVAVDVMYIDSKTTLKEMQ